jgi:hypothetical protein
MIRLRMPIGWDPPVRVPEGVLNACRGPAVLSRFAGSDEPAHSQPTL